MSVERIARDWLHRPLVILICGRGEYAALLVDSYVKTIHARSRAELDVTLRSSPIDVAIVDDLPWMGEDAITVGRLIRGRGIGTVFATRSADAGVHLLRERLTVNLSATPFRDSLDNAVWFACCETELMRRDARDWWNRLSGGGAPAFMRFVEENGHLAPSQSTFMYIFSEASNAEGAPQSLVAPDLPAGGAWDDDSRSTVALQPSESLLQTLRRERDRALLRWHPLTWAMASIGVLTALLALIHFLSR